MRYLPLLLPLALAACHKPADEEVPATPAGPPLPTVACTVAGSAGRCSVERIETPQALELVVRDAEGGFRRFVVTEDGRGVAAADGAQPATVTVIGPGTIEVAVAGDRYHLPATVGPDASAAK